MNLLKVLEVNLRGELDPLIVFKIYCQNIKLSYVIKTIKVELNHVAVSVLVEIIIKSGLIQNDYCSCIFNEKLVPACVAFQKTQGG